MDDVEHVRSFVIMMNIRGDKVANHFDGPFDALIDKYTELLLGTTNEELKEKVIIWVLYQHIAKSMPPLAKHWNSLYPKEKERVKEIIQEIKELNEKHRQNRS